MLTKKKVNLHGSVNDEWLTPPELVKALGKFDTDPCCSVNQPWKTAVRMYDRNQNGLDKVWRGRVWLNPPYSNCRPFIDLLVKHGNGIALLSAKSTDSRWGQKVLENADAVLFLSGRLLFHFPDGTKSEGKWLANMLAAFGNENVKSLKNIIGTYPGILMRRIK